MSAPFAETRKVVRRFGDVVAVDGVDLRIHSGEVVGLLGANGAGKTTLIRMLLGLLRPSEGAALLFGQAPSRHTRRRLGYVPQGLGLYDDLTPAENLAFARAVFGGDDEHLPDALQQSANELVGRLPLGVQRRVAFVQALAHRPDLLVLDEPTSGVDPLARASLWDTIGAAAEHGAGVLVTTHFMREAEQCNRLIVMADGRIVAEGTLAEIVGDARVAVVESDQWAQAFDTLERAGMSTALDGRSLRVPDRTAGEVERALAGMPARVHEEAATLDERFFQLTLDSPGARSAT